MAPLNLPRPAWMTEDVAMLEEQVRRFIAAEFVPHLDRWHDDGIYDQAVWRKAGEAGLLCAAMPEEYGGGGGSFAHEAVTTANCRLPASIPSARRCIPASSRLIFSTTAPRSRKSAGCPSSPPASWSPPSP